mgnify:CR=1 FL=1
MYHDTDFKYDIIVDSILKYTLGKSENLLKTNKKAK